MLYSLWLSDTIKKDQKTSYFDDSVYLMDFNFYFEKVIAYLFRTDSLIMLCDDVYCRVNNNRLIDRVD